MSNEINDLLKKLDDRMDRQEDMMQQLLQMIAQNNQNQEKMDNKIDRIEETILRIENSQPADIMAMLKQIHNKLDERDNEIQVLKT